MLSIPINYKKCPYKMKHYHTNIPIYHFNLINKSIQKINNQLVIYLMNLNK